MYIDPTLHFISCVTKNLPRASGYSVAVYGVAIVVGLRNYWGGRGEALKLCGYVHPIYVDILSYVRSFLT